MDDVINSPESLENYIITLRRKYDNYRYLRISVKTGEQRSNLQNRSLHLFCSRLSKQLNDAGLDFRKVIREDLEVPWDDDGYMVKRYLWKPLQEAMTGHSSTVKPKTKQYIEIFNVLSRHLAQKLGINAIWPSKDNMND